MAAASVLLLLFLFSKLFLALVSQVVFVAAIFFFFVCVEFIVSTTKSKINGQKACFSIRTTIMVNRKYCSAYLV